jgi:type I restriction enzyme S subunit
MSNGWPVKTLDQIATNMDSQRIPITKADRVGGEYPHYGASGIVDFVADYIFDGDTLLVSEDGANLLARSTPIAFPASGKYWGNNHAHILKFDDMATQRFVEHFLESIPLDEYITDAAQPKLNQRALNSIPISVPPARRAAADRRHS